MKIRAKLLAGTEGTSPHVVPSHDIPAPAPSQIALELTPTAPAPSAVTQSAMVPVTPAR
jgi:hypothetical protein